MKLSMDEIHLMNALSQVAKVSAKDCLVDGNTVSFLVKEEDVGKAIGKKAGNVRALQEKLNKRIEIIGWQEEPAKAISKALGIEVLSVKDGGDRLILGLDSLNRKKAMASGPKMKRVRELVRRNYGKEITFK